MENAERESRLFTGQILARVPALLGLTHSQFGDRIGVKPNQLSAWYSGAENPNLSKYANRNDPQVFAAFQWACAEANGQVVRPVIELPALKVG